MSQGFIVSCCYYFYFREEGNFISPQDFARKSDAEEALHGMNGKDLDGKRLVVEWTKGKPRTGRSGSPRGYDSGRRRGRSGTGRRPPERSDYRLAVYNLPDRCHWSELKDHFRQAGDVVFSDVMGTRGVIEYKYRDDMENAIKELNGVKWRGYSLQVEKDLRSRDSYRRSRRSRSRSRNRSRSDSRSRSPSYSRSRSRSRSSDKKVKKHRERSESRENRSHDSPRESKKRKHSRSPSRSLSPKEISPVPEKEKLTP